MLDLSVGDAVSVSSVETEAGGEKVGDIVRFDGRADLNANFGIAFAEDWIAFAAVFDFGAGAIDLHGCPAVGQVIPSACGENSGQARRFQSIEIDAAIAVCVAHIGADVGFREFRDPRRAGKL